MEYAILHGGRYVHGMCLIPCCEDEWPTKVVGDVKGVESVRQDISSRELISEGEGEGVGGG